MDGYDDPQIWMVAANILSEQARASRER